jgi:hypothetical protein
VGGVCTTGSKGTWLWLHGLVGRVGLPSRDYGHPLGARGRVACEPAAAGCWARASVLLVRFFLFFPQKNTCMYCIVSGIAGYAGAYLAYPVDPLLSETRHES